VQIPKFDAKPNPNPNPNQNPSPNPTPSPNSNPMPIRFGQMTLRRSELSPCVYTVKLRSKRHLLDSHSEMINPLIHSHLNSSKLGCHLLELCLKFLPTG